MSTMKLNPTVASDFAKYIGKATGVTAGTSRWLALTTDLDGQVETTDYAGRIQIDSDFGTPSADGDGNTTMANNAIIGPFNFTAGDTILGMAICNHATNPISASYLQSGPLDAAQIVAPGGSISFSIGQLTIDVANED